MNQDLSKFDTAIRIGRHKIEKEKAKLATFRKQPTIKHQLTQFIELVILEIGRTKNNIQLT